MMLVSSALNALLLLFYFVFGGGVAERLPCPLPANLQHITESICTEYTACEWVSGACLLRHQNDFGYTIEESNHPHYTLKHNSQHTLYGADIKTLNFTVQGYGSHHVRVKIYDSNNARYEVPVPLNLPQEEIPENAEYEVLVENQQQGEIFDFKIKRRSTGTILFDTSKISGFVFEDQFIQISSRLPSSYVYGMGENIHTTFKHKFENKTFAIFTRDEFPNEGQQNLYGCHPVYHCIEDHNGNSHATLFYNSNAMEYEFRELSDGSEGFVYRTIGGILDIHFFLGPKPEDLIKQYTRVIGFPVMPPYWSLGFQLSRWGYNNIENMQAAVNRTRDALIPHDVQYLDIDYFYRKRVFTYDNISFPGLPDYIRYLKDEGVHFVTILDPALVIDFENYGPVQRGRDKDVFIKWGSEEDIPEDQPECANDYVVGYVWPDTKTVFPDFSFPPTTEWWSSENKLFHQTIEFDGLWIDMNEVSNFGTNEEKPWNWPEGEPAWSLKCANNSLDEPPYPTVHLITGDNKSGTFPDKSICMIAINRPDDSTIYQQYDVHSLYGYQMAKATYPANYVSTQKRPFVVSRSTFPGSGTYAGHWLGDNVSRWVDLHRSIIGMFEFNMFGIPYIGADICGFFDTVTEEMCARWMSLGAFYPFARNHNADGNPDQDPGLWENVAEASRTALGARYTMLPYLYTLFYHAHVEGRSVIRPLLNEFPTDLQAREVDDMLMWGSSILIAPVLEEGSTSKEAYFPDALWYDYWTKTLAFDSPGSRTLDIDITSLGLYIRGGGIIPTKPAGLNTDESRKNPFELIVALNANNEAEGDVFWDDGILEGSIEANKFYYSTFSFKNNMLEMKVQQTVAGISDELVLKNATFLGISSEPSDVLVSGQSVTYTYTSDKNLLDVQFTWDMSQDMTLQIKQ